MSTLREIAALNILSDPELLTTILIDLDYKSKMKILDLVTSFDFLDDIRVEVIAAKRKYLDQVKSSQWQFDKESRKEGYYSLDEKQYEREQIYFAYTFKKNSKN